MLGYSLAILSLAASTKAATWGYIPGVDGPDTWPDPACQTGTSQSPIDIPHNVTYVDDWLPFQFNDYEKPRKMFVANNGHSAVVNFLPKGCDDNTPTIAQGNLPAVYELAQFHFHWGSKHHKGSEHEIHGKQTEAELHFVHYNTECGRTLAEVVVNCGNDPNALAVLGVMIEEGHENSAYDNILDVLHHIEQAGNETHMKPVSLLDLMPGDRNEFWRYQGGLTTPGAIGGNDCAEIVIWTVFKNKVTLSKRQLRKFLALKTSSGGDLENNYRPPQPLNGREVWFANLELQCHDHDENDWKKNHECNIGHRETKYEYDFNSAVHACIGYHYGNSVSQGLIPVGKLRCLRNRFGSAMNNDDHFCNRYYRVNGMKDEQGLWREYPSGRRVSFSHFPEFHEIHGSEGDTLIFDALQNRLYIDDGNDKYHALCFRDYQKDCEQCVGFETGHECSDAGYCMSNQCSCDMGFSGTACQNAPIPPKDLTLIGRDITTGPVETQSETYDTESNQGCNITSYESITQAAQDMMCDFAFGKGFCCGGLIDLANNLYTDMCTIYDCFLDSWSRFHDLPKKLTHASGAVVVGETGRDIGWLVSGGQESNDGTDLNMLYWLDEHLRWTTLDTALPTPLSYHCSVQINDCEIAIIGGTNASAAINIYNYKENTWRMGPELDTAPTSLIQLACEKIVDKSNYHTYVVIGGIGTYEPRIWDTQTGVVIIDDQADPAAYNKRYHRLDENTLIMSNGPAGGIYTYRVDEGFMALSPLAPLADHSMGDSFLAPRRTTTCWAHQDFDPY
jgi:carbonic anhydrase